MQPRAAAIVDRSYYCRRLLHMTQVAKTKTIRPAPPRARGGRGGPAAGARVSGCAHSRLPPPPPPSFRGVVL